MVPKPKGFVETKKFLEDLMLSSFSININEINGIHRLSVLVL